MDLSFSTENARYAFGQHDRITIDGQAFRVQMEMETGYILAFDDETGLANEVSHEELARLGHEGRIRVEREYFSPVAARKRMMTSEVTLSALFGRQERRVTKKDLYVQVAEEMRHEGLLKYTDASIRGNMYEIVGRVQEIAPKRLPEGDKELKPSEDFGRAPAPRTLRRWRAEKNKFGLLGLVDSMSLRGNRTSRFSPEAISLIMKEVRRYLSADKPTIKQIYEDVVTVFIERNEDRAERGLYPLTIPSRETVRRAIRSLDPFQVVLARHGEAVARKRFRAVTTGILLTRPLERVEIDEWTVDVQTLLQDNEIYGLLTEEERASLGLDFEKKIDPRTGKIKQKKTVRWTLTAAICCATRCILGLVISRSPNSEAAVQLLEMITVNKGAWAKAVDARTPWDMHGTPELIVFDGGAAFKSLRFRMAAEDMGIAWEMAMNGVPENRGTIERVFKTFAGDFAPRLSGHTGSNIFEKGDSDPEKRAALTLDDFTFVLVRWVVDIYHNSPHRGLGGEKPVQAWRRLSKKYGVTPPPDHEMMRLCFGQQRVRRLDKTGLTVLGAKYQSAVLQNYMRRKDPKEVKVRWHPKDIGAISVLLGKKWLEVPALDNSLKGVPAQTWLTAVNRVQSADPTKNRLNNEVVREAIKAIKLRNENAMANAGLNLQDWSEERMQYLEDKVLAGVEFFEPAKPTKAKGELGQHIPATSELTGEEYAGTDQTGVSSSKAAPAVTFEED